jgi:arabinose-5-phosphate isomerase
MMLALGDALAVALMERRGFSSDDFRVFHPGGRLGQQLIKVADIMHAGERVPLVPAGTAMPAVLAAMTAGGFGCVGVTAGDGGLIGIVTDGDLRRRMDADILKRSVEEVMTKAPKTISPKALAAEALNLMNAAEHPFTALFVTEDGAPCGFLHMHDILRAGIV